MRVKLDRVFPLAVGADDAWRLLQDVEQVAACMPGARITEQIDATHYKGEINVKIGPASAAFKGDLEVQEMDQAARRLKLLGKGADARGASTASMELTAGIREAGEGSSELAGDCEVQVNGKLASFGGRMMNQVSSQILDQFADNFGARIQSARDAAKVGGDGVTGAAAAEPERQLNALVLLWRSLVGMIKDLFRSKPAPRE